MIARILDHIFGYDACPIGFPVPWFNKDHTKAIARWSAGWTGGTLYFEKTADGTWTVEETERWIT